MNNTEYINYLTKELRKDEEVVFKIYCELRRYEGKEGDYSIQSMKCTIGSKNNTFTDCVNSEFVSPKDFWAEWLKGLCDQYGDKVFNGPQGPRQNILLEMLKYPVCKKYIYNFLERNFYRNFYERTRYKPSSRLWEVWFGSNPLFWGIMICPVYRNNQWTNDVSEIRRTCYEYWTVGHVMQTGIVMPAYSVPYRFSTLLDFMNFYYQIMLRVSRSTYEQEIMKKYFEYLQNVDDVYGTPLLIPEFRFYNDEIEHKYRLDFTILNSYTRQLIGFEISPQSTHMNISGIRKEMKTQIDINNEIKEKWEKEMKKRNEFFSQYGITVITFTDNQLADIDNCFNTIKCYLEQRCCGKANFEEQEERLTQILNKAY